jgi:preprotein translocase subunit SecD
VLLVIAAAPVVCYLIFSSYVRPRPGVDQLRGGEVTYRLLYPENFRGDRTTALAQAVVVLSGRLRAADLKKFQVTPMGQDQVRVSFEGVSREEFDCCKRLAALWNCELREVAPLGAHESWNPGDPAPEGFVAVPNDDQKDSSERLSRAQILVTRMTLVEGKDVKSATAAKDSYRTGNWIVEFELSDAGAKKLDAATERLYGQSPHGRIAIVKNGRVHSKPVVQSPRIGGRVQIHGTFTQTEAESLAVVLRNGALPVPIGRRENGRDQPGEPESETYVDLTPARSR